ncbi:MAG: 50S ribosomal protein L25 [Candidatus Levybacteria bacterium]|nr:50S ribosomal protein L25 [Candidatus Levybacteria bacterium]
MATRQKLKVEKREIFGKKLKKLRREGLLPANIYGKDIKSQAVLLPVEDFKKTYKEVGETGLIDIELDGKSTPVLIHNTQVTFDQNILHTDFYKVNLKEKVKAMIPIEFIGEPKAVTEKIGILMHILNEVEVEALPEELPENVEVNVEPLAAIDEQITVADLKTSEGVTLLTDPAQVVAKIGELITKEAQELAAEEAAAAEAASAEASAEAGEEAPEAEGEPEQTQGEESTEKTPEEQPKES